MRTQVLQAQKKRDMARFFEYQRTVFCCLLADFPTGLLRVDGVPTQRCRQRLCQRAKQLR
jgi:hypothetical protein